MALKFRAYIAQVTSRKATDKVGRPVLYYSAVAMDMEPNPGMRYPGQVEFQTNEDEIKTLNICEGAEFEMNILNIVAVRNGIPVVQAKLSPASKPK
jgi:hypothetical protein